MLLSTGRYLGLNKECYDADGVIVSETHYHTTAFEGWHSHKNLHITLILEGGNHEERKKEAIEAVPGKVLFYNKRELHRNFNTKHPSRNINLEIENTFFTDHHLNFTCFQPANISYPEAKFTLLKIHRESKINDDHSKTSIHSLLLNLLNNCNGKQRPDKKWILRLREILHDNWNESHSLNSLSQALSVHPVTISKFFPQYFSCTLGDYIRKIRVEKATLLLKQSDMPLTSVAHHCGFYDQSHFIRSFKQLTGILPGQYKKL